MISRKHPVANWVLLPPHEQRRALDRVLAFRDRDPNPNRSGLPAAAIDYFWNEELPVLLVRAQVQQLARERIAELRAKASGLREKIEVQSASMQREAADADGEAQRIQSALEAAS